MAAVTLLSGEKLDLNRFAAHIVENLPVYARPYFLRLPETAETTSTFKQIKTRLQKQGFDPKRINDSLYFLEPGTQVFVKLTNKIFETIQTAAIRF
jgi:hypothetical protein